MATLPLGVRVFLCTQTTDMRKSFDGLIAATKSVIGQDPLSGHLFVFVNRQANQTTFSIPIIVCGDRVPVAPASRKEGSAVPTRGQKGRGSRSC